MSRVKRGGSAHRGGGGGRRKGDGRGLYRAGFFLSFFGWEGESRGGGTASLAGGGIRGNLHEVTDEEEDGRDTDCKLNNSIV